jgi:hypothetical protein
VRPDFWVVQTFNGLSYGALLFLLASGLSLIFGVMRIVNLAHGSYFMLGGYVGLTVALRTQSFALACLAGAVAIGLIGMGMERFFLRRLRGETLGQVLMTIGFALIFQDLALLIWGGDPYTVPIPKLLTGTVRLGGAGGVERQMEDRSGAAGHTNPPGSDRRVCDERDIDRLHQVASRPSPPRVGDRTVGRQIAFAPVLRHRARDGIVQTSIQRPEILRADWRNQFDGQFRDAASGATFVSDNPADPQGWMLLGSSYGEVVINSDGSQPGLILVNPCCRHPGMPS